MHKDRVILVTGAAGFIGSALVKRLLNLNFIVVGLDNLNEYYDINLKLNRLKEIDHLVKSSTSKENWFFYKEDLKNYKEIKHIFEKHRPKYVVNLAAQAGVRYSLEKPFEYIESNLVGFVNILEVCRKFDVKHLIYASSSSVYGSNQKLPFKEEDHADHPISLYAATKRSNELMAHSYSHLYKFPVTGLRFFTIYGPFGRPDMAPMIFSKAILNGEPINLFNNGNMKRDFTFIDDAVESIIRCSVKLPSFDYKFDKSQPNPSSSFCSYRVFNVSNNDAVNLIDFLALLEDALGKKAIINYKDMQPGDVKDTLGDNSLLENWIDFRPNTSLKKGIQIFAEWYLEYFKD